jgi:hypothetical protein
MPGRPKVTPPPEKDPIARGWDIESQVRMLLNQPPPDPLAQGGFSAEVRRILIEGGKREARGADVGPPILGPITGIPERAKPARTLTQGWVDSQVRTMTIQPLPAHLASKKIPGRDCKGRTTWHSITEMPGSGYQVRTLPQQPPPDEDEGMPTAGKAEVGPPGQDPIGEKPERAKPKDAGIGPPKLDPIADKPERPKTEFLPSPPVKAVDQPTQSLRPDRGTHRNKLAAQLEPRGGTKGARTDRDQEQVVPLKNKVTVPPSFQASQASKHNIQNFFVETAKDFRGALLADEAAEKDLSG